MLTRQQTSATLRWSGVGTTTGFFSVWNNVARDVVLARNLSLVETARALQLVCATNDVPVAVTWSVAGGLPGTTRHSDGFWQAAEKEAMDRIYGGIHYRFDPQAGQHVGRSVAESVFANFMRPRARWLD